MKPETSLGPSVQIVDAFTRVPGTGNRAGVVLDGTALDEGAMQRIATAVAASETAFILPPPEGAAVRLRYFTPKVEIRFCGHATVATFHCLAESGALPVPGRHVLDTPAGRVEIDLEKDEAGGARVWMATPRHPWKPNPIADAALMPLLGASEGMRDSSLPVEQAGHHLYVPVKSRAELWSLTPQWGCTRARGREQGGVNMEVTGAPERIDGVRVSGVAITVLEGWLSLGG